jgi:hypothetical protein
MAKLRVDKIASVGVSTETTGSVYFDGTSDGLRSDAYDELIIGTGAFTVECWFWRENITDSWGSLVSDNLYSAAGGWDLYTRYNDIHFYVGGVGEVFEVSDCYSAQTWTHVAAQRDSAGNMSCYINGVNQNVSASNSTDYTDNRILIGGNNSPAGSYPAYVFNGYISNVRVCRGHTVYTSNFSVPTRELEVHPGPSNDKTIFLACYDGENVFAEKTGKIIAANGDRLSSPTPTATDSPIGITTENPGLTRDVDNTFGPVFQGGAAFTSQNWLTLPKGTTTQRSGGRGIYAGLRSSTAFGGSGTKNMQFWHIPSGGIGQDFGDLVNANSSGFALSSATRGVFAGGFVSPAYVNVIEYVTIAATGNAVDFGDLLASIQGAMPLANSTRGIFGGDNDGLTIDFITIATLGNAQDFGDFSSPASGKRERGASFASPTRGIFAGGKNAPSGFTNAIDYITISSLGDTTNFGDLLQKLDVPTGCSSSTRGVIAGGTTPTYQNTIQYITISTLGDAQDFGDLRETQSGQSGMTNSIRGVFDGGYAPNNPTATRFPNIIDFVTIVSTGNSVDFGDIGLGRGYATCRNSASDSHGGLS